MKSITAYLCLLIITMNFVGCIKDDCTQYITYDKYTPIVLDASEYRVAPTLETPREFERTGKIYYYNNYILLNEYRKGVHLINNQNPRNPINEAFINIPGNVDVAVKNGILFADSYIDLISVRLNNFENLEFLKREEAVFPDYGVDSNGWSILGYDIETVSEVVECNSRRVSFDGGWAFASEDLAIADSFNGSSGGGGNSGIAGSLARFSIINDHLYIVDESNMKVFGIGNGEQLDYVKDFSVGTGIETIFGHNNKLFIGGNVGMSIYDLVDPASPMYLGGYEHIFSCDPVFVKDNYAYVTLRSGTPCQGFINQLDLVDITDPTRVQLVKSFTMDNPHGLSISENNLFICEGEHGLKTFDIADPETLDSRMMSFLQEIQARDIIALPGIDRIILVVGPDGIYQYNYDDPTSLELLSFITIPKV